MDSGGFFRTNGDFDGSQGITKVKDGVGDRTRSNEMGNTYYLTL